MRAHIVVLSCRRSSGISKFGSRIEKQNWKSMLHDRRMKLHGICLSKRKNHGNHGSSSSVRVYARRREIDVLPMLYCINDKNNKMKRKKTRVATRYSFPDIEFDSALSLVMWMQWRRRRRSIELLDADIWYRQSTATEDYADYAVCEGMPREDSIFDEFGIETKTWKWNQTKCFNAKAIKYILSRGVYWTSHCAVDSVCEFRLQTNDDGKRWRQPTHSSNATVCI